MIGDILYIEVDLCTASKISRQFNMSVFIDNYMVLYNDRRRSLHQGRVTHRLENFDAV